MERMVLVAPPGPSPACPTWERWAARGLAQPWASWTDRVEVTWIEAGGASWSLRGRTYEVGAGDVVLVPGGALHTGTPLAPTSDVHVAWIPDAYAVTLRAPRVLVGKQALARRLFSALDAPDGALAATEALERLLADDARTRSAPAEPAAVRCMRDRLHADLRETPTLADLAEDAGIGRFAALRAFTRAVGVTPHTYLREVRLTHAQALLRAGATCAEAAHAAGFVDEAHFSRWHHRRHGVPPGVYARAFRRTRG
jgi:AraC-like DNA-binding protein